MKKKIITISAAALLLSWSCTPVHKSRTTKTLEIYGAGVIHTPVIADLRVRETRTSGTATAMSASYLESARQQAIASAIESADADVLVEPVFKTTTMGARVTVTVTGYPAQYKNFRNATAADTAFLKIGILQKPQSTERQAIQPPKKNAGGAIAGVLLTVGLIILLVALL